MNIKKFASTPKLVEVTISDADIVEKYGEPITFHTYDRVTMGTYFGFFGAQTEGEFDNLSKMMKQLILDADGKPVLADHEDLPIDIAAAAISHLGEVIGNSLNIKKPEEQAAA